MHTLLNPRARRLATTSLIAGILWIILAIAPTFITSLVGLPFAGYALLVGWQSRQSCLRFGDASGARRGAWGVGLGCAGFVYIAAFYLIAGGLLLAGLVTLIQQFTGGGTPIP